MKDRELQVTTRQLPPEINLGNPRKVLFVGDVQRPDYSTLFRLTVGPKKDIPIDEKREALRRTVSHVEEVDSGNLEELKAYSEPNLKLLKRKSNRYHFVAIPNSVGEMMENLQRPESHGLTIYNALDEAIGFTRLDDPSRDQGDSWLNTFVIDDSLQNNGNNGIKGVGQSALSKVVDYSFETPTYDGRIRNNLYAAIVLFVPNADRMYGALRKVGFETAGGGKDDQAIVTMPNGNRESKPTLVLGIKREKWEDKKFREMHEGEHLLVN